MLAYFGGVDGGGEGIWSLNLYKTSHEVLVRLVLLFCNVTIIRACYSLRGVLS